MKYFMTACLLAISSSAFAEGETAFGISMGMKKAELDYKIASDAHNLVLKTVPELDLDFQQYRVVLTEETGVCMVMASGAEVASTGEGQPLKDEFYGAVERFSEIYGVPVIRDSIHYQSNWWKRDDRFMLALSEKKADLIALWDQKNNAIIRGTDFKQIAIQGFAPNRYKGNVVAYFKFNNYADCKKIMENNKALKE